MSQIYYLLRSRLDGSYLVAHPQPDPENPKTKPGFLLVFTADYDALSYLNIHGGAEVAEKFAVESVIPSRLNTVLERWGLAGVGMVKEPRPPEVEFYSRRGST